MTRVALINLHSHLEGRVRPDTAAEIGARRGLPEPAAGWERAIQLDGPADLTVYLERVAATYPFFDRAESLFRIAAEAVEDAAADGQDYLELRFGPVTHERDGFDADDVIAAVCAGLAEGTRRTDVPAGLVIAALRHCDAETNERMARAAARAAGSGVVGFDLAGDELRFPALEPFAESFAIARAAGLGLTCHAAEAAPASAALQAIALLRVSRIGHGAHLAEDADAMAQVADAGVTVEVCPTSNWYTGAIASVGEHPAARFREAGIPLALGDDNPLQTRSSLPQERTVLRDVLGFDAAALERLDRSSVEAAFVDDGTRAALRSLLPA